MARVKPAGDGGSQKAGTSSSLAPPPPPAQTRVPSSADLKKEALHHEVLIVDHKLSPEEMAQKYGSDLENGLTTEKAEELLKKFGPNALEPPKTIPEWLM